jgi:hypothetical protein
MKVTRLATAALMAAALATAAHGQTTTELELLTKASNYNAMCTGSTAFTQVGSIFWTRLMHGYSRREISKSAADLTAKLWQHSNQEICDQLRQDDELQQFIASLNATALAWAERDCAKGHPKSWSPDICTSIEWLKNFGRAP